MHRDARPRSFRSEPEAPSRLPAGRGFTRQYKSAAGTGWRFRNELKRE
jgi:hypothetical protein